MAIDPRTGGSRVQSAPSWSPGPISGWPCACGSCIALPVGDAAAGEVVWADFHQHLVASQELDAKLGQLPRCAAQTLMSGGLLEGDKVKTISLLFFNHTGRFDHAEMQSHQRSLPILKVCALPISTDPEDVSAAQALRGAQPVHPRAQLPLGHPRGDFPHPWCLRHGQARCGQ